MFSVIIIYKQLVSTMAVIEFNQSSFSLAMPHHIAEKFLFNPSKTVIFLLVVRYAHLVKLILLRAMTVFDICIYICLIAGDDPSEKSEYEKLPIMQVDSAKDVVQV